MPEAPEVRKYADQLNAVLAGQKILSLSARTKQARAWLFANPEALIGLEIQTVFARGKNVVALIEGGYYFYSHQMMWGRWEIHSGPAEVPADRKERARITTDDATAILMSAPIFEIGKGDPLKEIPYLKQLGPDVLTYGKAFDEAEFRKRFSKRRNKRRTIGDALLDQQIVAGIGNYLRAEIMFIAKINPWTLVKDLSEDDLDALCELIPKVSAQAYEKNGTTVTPALKRKMQRNESLVYVPGKEYGTRHYVFRRTNLPCLICSTPVKQLRQLVTPSESIESSVSTMAESKIERTAARTTAAKKTSASGLTAKEVAPDSEEEKSRIVYFCPSCQNVEAELYLRKRR